MAASGTSDFATYTLTYSLAGSPELPWVRRDEIADRLQVKRYAYAFGVFNTSPSQIMQVNMQAWVGLLDGGGVRQTFQFKNGSAPVQFVSLMDLGNYGMLTFNAEDSLLAGSRQGTLDSFTWTGAPAVFAAPATRPR